jgi:hypothetical protein
MIQQNSDTQFSTNGLEANNFSIEVNSSMFDLLTKNVYNDPMLAIIREWSTNAIDACVAAGKEPEFYVHLPTKEEPEFYVRDYGTGLSKEDILGLFSTLGASTKRNSNDFNGTFGLGRMAALSYSVTFNVDSFYKGIHYCYSVTKAEGTPKIVPLYEGPTDEPNGLKLSVPIKVSDIEFFLDKASSVYKFFDTKPMLNTPIDIELSIDYKISDDWFILSTANNGIDPNKNYVLMSNVLYAIPSNNQIEYKNFRGLVMILPNGSVSYNPGRESLSLDSITIETINQKFRDFLREAKLLAEQDIQDQPNDFARYQTYQIQYSKLPKAVTIGVDIADYFTHIPASKFRYNGLSTTIANNYNNTFTFKRKSRYGKVFKEDDALSFYALTHSETLNFLLLDVKSGFNDYIKNTYKDKEVLLIARTHNKVDMDLFVTEATRFINDIGLPKPTPISTLLPPAPTKEEKVRVKKAKQEGIQLSSYSSHSNSFSNTYTADKNLKYVYVELSNKTPNIDNLHSYVTIINLRKDIDPDFVTPIIVGVQKGYIPKVLRDDNFTEFMQYFNDNVKNYDYRIKSVSLEEVVNRHFAGITTAPTKIMDTLNFIEKTKNYISHHYLTYFNKTMVDHATVEPPHTREDLIKEYPLLDTFYNRWGYGTDDPKHYMELLYELEILSSGRCNNLSLQG